MSSDNDIVIYLKDYVGSSDAVCFAWAKTNSIFCLGHESLSVQVESNQCRLG